MKPRRPSSLPTTLSLAGAIALHGVLARTVLESEIKQADEFARRGYTWLILSGSRSSPESELAAGPLVFPPAPQALQETSPAAHPDLQPLLDPEKLDQVPAVALLPAPPPEDPGPDLQDRFKLNRFGAEEDLGPSVLASDGEGELAGFHADQVQPWLTRNPTNQPVAVLLPGEAPGGPPSPASAGGGSTVSQPDKGIENPNPNEAPFGEKENTPNAIVGVPGSPLPRAPQLALRPPVRDVQKPQPAPAADPWIGLTIPIEFSPHTSAQPSTRPNLAEAIPASEHPDQIVEDLSKSTPPDPQANHPAVAVAETTSPTTQPSEKLLVEAIPEGVNTPLNQQASGPVTRPSEAYALAEPRENAVHDPDHPDHLEKPSTRPAGDMPDAKVAYDPQKEKNTEPQTTRPPTSVSDTSPAVAQVPGPRTAAPEPAPPAQDAAPVKAVAMIDPGRPSPMDSSPTSVQATVNMRAGKITAQLGRQVKPIRPQFNIASWVEGSSLVNAKVTLRIAIDETGTVTDVRIAKSSGSREIDDPARASLYKWWIEPRTDKQGNKYPDVILLDLIIN